jgi:hypothetical protein
VRRLDPRGSSAKAHNKLSDVIFWH